MIASVSRRTLNSQGVLSNQTLNMLIHCLASDAKFLGCQCRYCLGMGMDMGQDKLTNLLTALTQLYQRFPLG